MARTAPNGGGPKPFIVDADAHYFEPLEEIIRYLPEPWRRRVAKQSLRNLLPNSMGDREVAGRIRRDNVSYPKNPMSPAEVPAAMQFLGVDVSILVSQRLITFGANPVKDMAVALANGSRFHSPGCPRRDVPRAFDEHGRTLRGCRFGPAVSSTATSLSRREA
jgi:hypothetical protein